MKTALLAALAALSIGTASAAELTVCRRVPTRPGVTAIVTACFTADGVLFYICRPDGKACITHSE